MVENRVQLVDKLREIDLLDKSDLAAVAEALTVSIYVLCLKIIRVGILCYDVRV